MDLAPVARLDGVVLRSDDRVAGIAPWHWGDCDGCDKFRDEIGTARTIKTKAAWTQIGHEIKGKTAVGEPPVVAAFT